MQTDMLCAVCSADRLLQLLRPGVQLKDTGTASLYEFWNKVNPQVPSKGGSKGVTMQSLHHALNA